MNWGDLNPLKRVKKPTGKVYVGANPEHPHVGIALITDERPETGSFCVEGISLGQAKTDLCGKVFDWGKVYPPYIASLKTGGCITLPLDRLKSLFR